VEAVYLVLYYASTVLSSFYLCNPPAPESPSLDLIPRPPLRVRASGQLLRQRSWIRRRVDGDYKMVLDLLTAAGLPVTIATVEGSRQIKKEDREEQEQYRMRDFCIDVFCNSGSRKRDEVDKTMVVLRNHKLYLAKKAGGKDKYGRPLPASLRQDDAVKPHPFTGFYLDYHPSKPGNPTGVPSMFERLDKPKPIRGLVTTISDDPPTLNWLYVDKSTLEVKYGTRNDIEALERQSRLAEQGRLQISSGVNQIKPHNVGVIMGPWDWTDEELGLTMEGWEGFVAVEEKRGLWAVYYDRDDDGLSGYVEGRRVLQCSLERRVLQDEDDEEDILPRRK
jgi:hypothetical protein